MIKFIIISCPSEYRDMAPLIHTSKKELLSLTLIKTTDLFVSTEFVVLEHLGGFVMNIHVKHGCGSGMYDLKHTVFFPFCYSQ